MPGRHSKSTEKTYGAHVGRFQVWLDGREPSEATAQEYVDHLEEEGKAPNTIATCANALRDYFGQKGQVVKLVSPTIRLGEPRYKTVEEVYRILEGARTPLELCLVTVLFDTAVRIQELLDLQVDGIDWDQGFIHVVRKGGREADVNISDKGLAALKAWLEVRKFRSKQVFKNLSYYDVWRIFRDLGKRAGVPDFTPHTLRHARAVQMLNAGAELHDVQRALGHTSIATTANIYGRLRPADLKQRIPDW